MSRFEEVFAAEFGFAHAVALSSGSMANLIAVAALVERGDLSPGDHVVVSGTTFVSAVAPVAQLGLVPVFVDVEQDGVNVDVNLVEDAIVDHGARAVLLPHTLGQPIDLERIKGFAKRHGIAMIEDCCESLGARVRGTPIGGIGDVATFSFYAGHHITMGEGGIAACHDDETAALLRSLRAFGRDMDYVGKRFGYHVSDRRIASEERYVHLRLGYNAKLTDLQAAFGLVQLTRHAGMAQERIAAADAIQDVFNDFPDWRILGQPTATGCSPFGVAFLVPPGRDLAGVVATLMMHRIESRGFLGSSLPDQPCFDSVPYIVHEPYARAHDYARRALIIGCPPGLDLTLATNALRKALVTLVRSENNG